MIDLRMHSFLIIPDSLVIYLILYCACVNAMTLGYNYYLQIL